MRPEFIRALATVATFVITYFVLALLVSYLLFDVFKVDNQQANLKDLAIELAPYVVPLVGAVFAAGLVAKSFRGQ